MYVIRRRVNLIVSGLFQGPPLYRKRDFELIEIKTKLQSGQ